MLNLALTGLALLAFVALLRFPPTPRTHRPHHVRHAIALGLITLGMTHHPGPGALALQALTEQDDDR